MGIKSAPTNTETSTMAADTTNQFGKGQFLLLVVIIGVVVNLLTIGVSSKVAKGVTIDLDISVMNPRVDALPKEQERNATSSVLNVKKEKVAMSSTTSTSAKPNESSEEAPRKENKSEMKGTSSSSVPTEHAVESSSPNVEAKKVTIENGGKQSISNLQAGGRCPWKARGPKAKEEQCKNLFKPRLEGKKRWFFMGDSNMYLMYKEIREIFEGQEGWVRTKEHKSGRCNYTDYFELPKAPKWVVPNYSLLEGPLGINYEPPKPWCSDLHWAFNQKMEKAGKSIEFIVSDFARDVETPSQTTATTQETIALYLGSNYPEKDQIVCITNTGLHDMAVPGPYHLAQSLYVENVQRYLNLLRGVCGTVIWITIAGTMDDPNWPQTNRRITLWNDHVTKMIKSTFPDVFVLDHFEESRKWKHADNTHMWPDYYQHMGKMWRQFADPTSTSVLKPTALNLTATA